MKASSLYVLQCEDFFKVGISKALIAKNKGRLRKTTIESKAMHMLAICKPDVVEKLTGVSQDRIIEVLGGSKLQEHELLRINTLWEPING